MNSMRTLTAGQRRALIFAVCVVVAGMGMGFAASYTTLYGAARAHHWTVPALLPLSVDSGILAYVVLDHLAVSLGSRSRWLHAAAWALAAFTVWANAAVAAGDSRVWRVIHAAMPALWVLGVEALRFMWHRLHETPQTAADRIPVGRWLAAPGPTFLLWRRKHLLNVASWPRMAAMEEARLHIRDRIRTALATDPGLVIPDVLNRAVSTGRLPAVVTAAIDASLDYGTTSRMEAEADAWVDGWLTHREAVSASLATRRHAIAQTAPAPPLELPSQAVAAPPSETPPRPRPKRPARPAPRRMSDDELLPYVEDLLSTNPAASIGDAIKATGTGRERARRLLGRARDAERQNRMVRVK